MLFPSWLLNSLEPCIKFSYPKPLNPESLNPKPGITFPNPYLKAHGT